MPCRSKCLLGLILTALAVAGPALPALALQTSSSEFVIIREDTVFPGDLYAGSIRVIVEGTIEGDLVAFAAEEVVIDGTVTGSVTVVSPVVTVNGEVGGSVRMSGNRLTVAGEVGRDVVAAAVTVDVTPDARVEGDVLAWSWKARAAGAIGNDLAGTYRRLDIAGAVGGDVDVSVARLEVVDELEVDGDLGFRSRAEAAGLDRAEVGGVVVDKDPLPPPLRVRALWALGRFLIIVMLAVAALTTAYGWPTRTRAAVERAGHRPFRRWMKGAAILFSPLLLGAATALLLRLAPAAAAFPLLAVLLPLLLALVGLVFALSLVAGVPAVGRLGGLISKRLDPYTAILVGSVAAGALWFLPLVGWLVPLVLLPWGLGAWIATWAQPESETVVSGPGVARS